MRKLSHIMRCQQGLAMVELAVVLPILLLFFLATFETVRFFLINQKLDKIAHSLASAASQSQNVSRSDIDTFRAAIPQMLRPMTLGADVQAVVTSMTTSSSAPAPCTGHSTATPCVLWVYGVGSTFTGGVGSTGTLPGGLQSAPEQNYIVAEVSYAYAPLVPTLTGIYTPLAPRVMYKAATYKTRSGAPSLLF